MARAPVQIVAMTAASGRDRSRTKEPITMPQTTRTFVAIAVPDPFGGELARLQRELAPLVAGCRWAAAHPFHATLAFLGAVKDKDLSEVCKTVAETAAAFDAFEVELRGVGAFPTVSRPRVIWAGMTAREPERLLTLQQSIVRAIARTGYRADDQRFHPHVTVGRLNRDRGVRRDLAAVLDCFGAWSGGSFTVTEVTTFASALSPGGPSYTPLGRAAMTLKKDETPS
jgi:2'-5' RNA ligase